MTWSRKAGYALIGAATLAIIACGGTVSRGTPAPQRTASPAPTPSPTAVSPTPAMTPTTASATPLPRSTPSPTPLAGTPTPTRTPRGPLPTPTQSAPVGEPISSTGSELTLDIFGLGEETIVKGTAIVVAGRTRADAVLSINGVIIPLDADGRFEVTVALQPGPNLIEVVVSDLNGNEKSRLMLVTALPEA
ncbi:MAG: hypothetical protein HY678_06800 [Chloroflexi bacterium]|nr:hypothetical protein [Chloroflexota bacterium]